MMPRHFKRTCRRKGCNAPAPGAPFCQPCWGRVPGWIKAQIAKARAAGDSAAITRLMVQASEAARPQSPSTQVYTNIARLTGEREEAPTD